jgi:hypothetical protein
LSDSSNPFCSGYFGDRVSCGMDNDLPILCFLP